MIFDRKFRFFLNFFRRVTDGGLISLKLAFPFICLQEKSILPRERLMIKYDVVFKKIGDMVYISHLDLMLMFRRAIRRSGMPFVLTKGFSPRVKISIPKALKLGVSSETEVMSLWLIREVDRDAVIKAINSELPEGVQLVSG